MHANRDDMNGLERQLAAWRPATTGLDVDAMLFAAGQAAARRRGSRFVWLAIAGGFAFLSLALGAELLGERSERLTLADRLKQSTRVVVEIPVPAAVPLKQPSSPDSYIAVRHLLEQDADGWLARSDHQAGPPPGPSEMPPILYAWPGVSSDSLR